MEAPQGAGGEKAVERVSHRGGFGVPGGHFDWTVVAGRGGGEGAPGGGSGRERDIRRQGGWPGAALGASELRAFSGDERSFVVKRNVWGTVLALFLLSLFLGLSSQIPFFSFFLCFALVGRCEGAGDWGAPA